MFRASLAALLFSAPAVAQETDRETAFVEANILSIFYHELGHAVIDVMDVSIFGQEEDAADVMSVLLIDWLFEEDSAQAIAYDSAFGFIDDPEGREEVAYWALHGPDEQRYFNHVCLFYGANPDEREDLAEELGLPEERAETCPEEYEQAADSWGRVFDEMEADGGGESLNFTPGEGAELMNSVLAPEIEAMNADITLPETIAVRVESCGEANAFYDPNDRLIVMCTEFANHLRQLFALNFGN